MLKILLPASDQSQIPLDTTDFDYDQFNNEYTDDSDDDLITNTEAGVLVGLGPNGHFLADGDATIRKLPLGFVINDAIQDDYQNHPTLTSREVSLVPLTAGVLVETDQYVRTEIDSQSVAVGFTRGKPVYCGTGDDVGLLNSYRAGESVMTEQEISTESPSAELNVGGSGDGTVTATLVETGTSKNNAYIFEIKKHTSNTLAQVSDGDLGVVVVSDSRIILHTNVGFGENLSNVFADGFVNNYSNLVTFDSSGVWGIPSGDDPRLFVGISGFTSGSSFSTNDHAAEFTTGVLPEGSDGFVVTSIGIGINLVPSSLEAVLRRESFTGPAIANLVSPDSFEVRETATFGVPDEIVLEADTTYYITVHSPEADGSFLSGAISIYDTGSLSDWSIGNRSFRSRGATGDWSSSTADAQISVSGYYRGLLDPSDSVDGGINYHVTAARVLQTDDADKNYKPIGYVYEDVDAFNEDSLLKVLVVGSGI